MVSPPPAPVVSNLFSDRGDGFSLMYLLRKGEDSVSKTIDLKYVSSGFRHGVTFDNDGAIFGNDGPKKGEESSSSELSERYTPTSPPPTRITPELAPRATGG
jgi:hypothetical protein